MNCSRCGAEDHVGHDHDSAPENQYTFFWRDGTREVLSGVGPADALNSAGYKGGALGALDFWSSGDNQEYVFKMGAWKKEQ